MRELFQRIRMEVYLSALLTIALGVVLLIWPLTVTGIICQILGLLLAVMGAVWVFGYFVERKGILTITGGLIFLLMGIWIFVRPDSVVRLVPIVIGVVLLVHSIRDFQMAAEAKSSGSSRWGALFAMALLSCVFGIVCICDSFGVVSVAVRLLGIALVYDGISDVFIVHHTVKSVKSAAERAEPVDVEWKEE